MPKGTKPVAAFESYVICTSPRSGSTLLCKLLAATGVSGRPGSHFHEPSLAAWLADYDLARADFPSERAAVGAVFDAAREEGTGETGMFGLRLQRHSFAFFMQKLDLLHPGLPDDPARFQAAFGRTLFLHLSRKNKLDQAISFVKARQTGLWHQALDGTELERLSPPQEPVYDAGAIAQQMAEFTTYDAEWNAWFTAAGIAPLRMTYDALAGDPSGALGEVLDHLGCDPRIAKGIAPPVAKLADDTSRIWAERFAAEQTNKKNSPPTKD